MYTDGLAHNLVVSDSATGTSTGVATSEEQRGELVFWYGVCTHTIASNLQNFSPWKFMILFMIYLWNFILYGAKVWQMKILIRKLMNRASLVKILNWQINW